MRMTPCTVPSTPSWHRFSNTDHRNVSVPPYPLLALNFPSQAFFAFFVKSKVTSRILRSRGVTHWKNTEPSSVLVCGFWEIRGTVVVWIVDGRHVIIRRNHLVKQVGLITCKEVWFGHAAKVTLANVGVRRTRFFGSGYTRQEFRAYESFMCRFERIIGERRSRWVKHQRGEGEKWSHDMRTAHTFLHSQTAWAKRVRTHESTVQCARGKMCVQQASVCTSPVAHTVVATTWVRSPCTTKENLWCRSSTSVLMIKRIQKKTINSTTRHDAPSGVQKCSSTGGDGSLDLCHPSPCCARLGYEHVVCARFKKIFLQIREVQSCFRTWDCLCEHSPGYTRTSGIGGCPSMEQSGPSFCFVCLLCDLLSFLIHCCFCIWSLHCFGWEIFCTCSRFASLTFLRDFHTLLYQNHGFSRKRLNRITSGVCTLFSLVPHLRVPRTSRALRLLEGFCPTVTLSARRGNMHLLSPFERN